MQLKEHINVVTQSNNRLSPHRSGLLLGTAQPGNTIGPHRQAATSYHSGMVIPKNTSNIPENGWSHPVVPEGTPPMTPKENKDYREAGAVPKNKTRQDNGLNNQTNKEPDFQPELRNQNADNLINSLNVLT
jgi:hypothetical protein